MKILHISAFDTYGAGYAALRIHLALLEMGVDSKLLCLHKRTEGFPMVYKYTQKDSLKLKIKKRIFGEEKEKNQNIRRNATGEFDTFSFINSDFRVEDHSFIKEADIVHLHWINNFINYSTFFRKIKKVVWTVHDKNLLFGGFHYELDKEKKNSLGNLDEKIRKNKIKFLSRINKLYIITPSEYLKNVFLAKSAISFDRIVNIYNTVNLNEFSPKKFDPDINDKNSNFILFVCDNMDLGRKGFKIVETIIRDKKYLIDRNIKFIIAGKNTFGESDRILNYGYINDIKLLAKLYASTDFTLLASKEDNLPNVMLESFASGTPLIGTPVGGINDLLQNKSLGVLSENITTEGIMEAIDIAIKNKNKYDRSFIRSYAEKNFSKEIIVKKHLRVYNDFLDN